MSKFKVGDVIECIDNGGYECHLTVRKKYEVLEIIGGCVMVITDNGDYIYLLATRFITSNNQSKEAKDPVKKHTETDRRKAAKQVRIAEKKLNTALIKAKETGINIDKINLESFPEINISMSYQPETPKKRIYK